jgi:hypothetical protein
VLADDHDRERATVTLREQYARGRLTLEELTDRIGNVLTARSHRELRTALAGLPGAGGGLVAAQARPIAQAVLRGAALVVFTGAYLVFSFALLTVFALTLLIQGASTAALVGFLTAWLVPTYLLVRFWHRRPQREAARPGA